MMPLHQWRASDRGDFLLLLLHTPAAKETCQFPHCFAVPWGMCTRRCPRHRPRTARLAQSVERKALNLVVVGSSPTVGVFSHHWCVQSLIRGTDESSVASFTDARPPLQ